MKNTYLLELGLEEMPAWMIEPALQQAREGFLELCREASLSVEEVWGWATPRRLSLLAKGLPESQPDREEVVSGPPRTVAFDEGGKPTRAAHGFARRFGVEVAELEVERSERGEYLVYRRKVPGRPVPDLLREMVPRLIQSLSWPKTMYWRESRFRFVRPLRWMLSLWGSRPLEFEFEGVRAGNWTRGHRFLGEQRIPIADPEQYLERLRENFVLASAEERRSKIERELQENLPRGLRLLPDARLLDLVVYLNEFPAVVRGQFDRRFLSIPQEVLVTVMRHHQKYFSVVDQGGELQPYFLAVINTRGDEDGRIRRGHERVLQARLDDAAFFWKVDRKIPLQERVEALKNVLFQEQLGSYWDKVERVRRLCRRLGGDEDLDRAAMLCKADLVTEMVKELPELQGVMGGLYAREEGYPESVWRPIYEHYLPQSLTDPCPATPNGALLSLADKLDTVAGCFSIGILPTGSSDPFALRRAAQGVIKILFEKRLSHPLPELVREALQPFQAEPRVQEEVLEFLSRRIRFILQEGGISYDVLNAVLAVPMGTVWDAGRRAQALEQIRREPDFEALAVAFKRIMNILADQQPPEEVREGLFQEPAEKELYERFRRCREEVVQELERGEYGSALKKMAGLRGNVDRFFDEVLVMAKEEELRQNRLALLQKMAELFLRVGDISQIVEGER